MSVKRDATVPMGAMWTQTPGKDVEQYGYDADVRESASVAHIYGQNLVAAESWTAGSGAWAWAPEYLKPTADKELAMGLNRFVIHTSVHQPLMGKAPGLGLGPFGQWFTRNETWAEQAKPWVTYLARSSYLLQQGRFVAPISPIFTARMRTSPRCSAIMRPTFLRAITTTSSTRRRCSLHCRSTAASSRRQAAWPTGYWCWTRMRNS
jgi:hypothetical protein